MRRQAAFSLLEMLVALALMSVLGAALYASLHAAFRARRSVNAAIEPVRTAGLAMELLRGDIESALPPTGLLAGSFLGEDEMDETSGADSDTLTWHANVGEPAENASDIVKLELLVTRLGEGNERALVRRTTTNLLAPTTPEPLEEVLCRAVLSFNLRYFDGSLWLDDWDSSAEGDTLPVAVEVLLEIDCRESEHDEAEGYELTRVFLLPCSASAIEEGTQVIRGSSW